MSVSWLKGKVRVSDFLSPSLPGKKLEGARPLLANSSFGFLMTNDFDGAR